MKTADRIAALTLLIAVIVWIVLASVRFGALEQKVDDLTDMVRQELSYHHKESGVVPDKPHGRTVE